MQTIHAPLLAAGEPPPFLELRASGASDFLITVDHAGARIPASLNSLGLAASDLERHIAWDIGALEVARRLCAALDATVIAQNYSRLVIDCNRDPAVPSSIPTVSEFTDIPGNRDLSEAAREQRRLAIFEPYHARIQALLDERAAQGRKTILVAQHSMTPIYKGAARAMQAAVLYNRDRRFAALLLEALRRESGAVIADNEPYFVSDETDYTIPKHGEARQLPHVEIEIRQDLITETSGQARWAGLIGQALVRAQSAFYQGHT